MSAAGLFTLNLAVDIRCVADFGIVEISDQSQKRTTFFISLAPLYIIKLILNSVPSSKHPMKCLEAELLSETK